jgi:hypothetical protein
MTLPLPASGFIDFSLDFDAVIDVIDVAAGRVLLSTRLPGDVHLINSSWAWRLRRPLTNGRDRGGIEILSVSLRKHDKP